MNSDDDWDTPAIQSVSSAMCPLDASQSESRNVKSETDEWDEPVLTRREIISVEWDDDIKPKSNIQNGIRHREIELKTNIQTQSVQISSKQISDIREDDNSNMWEETDPEVVMRQRQLLEKIENKVNVPEKIMNYEHVLSKISKTALPPISNIHLGEPYVGNVMSAIGTISQFANMVKKNENSQLLEKYQAYMNFKSANPKKRIPQSLTIPQRDIIRAENILKKSSEDENKNNGPTLDDWQAKSLEHIRKQQSVLIVGPTSGGKSYLIKYAISEIQQRWNSTKRIVLCLPTFPLALQTFADIYVSSKGFHASLLTENLNVVNPDSWIYVGTPITLNQYFQVNNLNYEIGIYDEIHAISLTTDNPRRSNAMAQLLSRCREQLILLSATVSSQIQDGKTDIDRLIEYLTHLTPISNIERVVYTQRIIPQTHLDFYNKDFETIGNPTFYEITSQSLFRMMVEMRQRDMLPALVFDLSEDSTHIFREFVQFLQREDSREYARYHSLCETVNASIEEYNHQVEENLEILYSTVSLDNLKGSTRSQIVRVKTEITQRRRRLSMEICDKIATTMEHCIEMIQKGVLKTEYPQPISRDYARDVNLHCQIIGNPTIELEILGEMYRLYNENVDIESYERLPLLRTKTPYFRFGNQFSTVFSDIRNPGTSDAKWQLRKMVLKMAEAEGLKRQSEVDEYIGLVMTGLEFGITCLMRRLPFVIQYQILEMLKNKQLSVLFTEESMSMGINYPLRTSVILSPEFREYPVSNLLQMAGRSGRRGYDTTSYVVYWNIANSNNITSDKITQIQFPQIIPIPRYTREHAKTILQNTLLVLSNGTRMELNMDMYYQLRDSKQHMEEQQEALRKSKWETTVKPIVIPEIVEYRPELLDMFLTISGIPTQSGNKIREMILAHHHGIFHEIYKTQWSEVSKDIEPIKEQIRMCYIEMSYLNCPPLHDVLLILHNDIRNFEYKMSKF